MSRLIWSQPALLNVQHLYRFLAPKNIEAAKRAVKAIREGVKLFHYLLSSRIARSRPAMVTGYIRFFMSCFTTEMDWR
jgi:plasmid stabilization system protein ParE